MSDQLLFSGVHERLVYSPHFAESMWFDVLREQVSWQQNQIRVFGKWHLEPRLTAWFGPAYKYSSVQWPAAAVPAFLKPLFQRVSDHCQFPFNAVLLNYYRDGNDAMGWHSDNEPEMDAACIASLSFGQQRLFHFRHKQEECKLKVMLEGGSLLVMHHFQDDWQHSVPRSKKHMEGRINLTFRRIITA